MSLDVAGMDFAGMAGTDVAGMDWDALGCAGMPLGSPGMLVSGALVRLRAAARRQRAAAQAVARHVSSTALSHISHCRSNGCCNSCFIKAALRRQRVKRRQVCARQAACCAQALQQRAAGSVILAEAC